MVSGGAPDLRVRVLNNLSAVGDRLSKLGFNRFLLRRIINFSVVMVWTSFFRKLYTPEGQNYCRSEER
jgi:hypothetical protein